MTGHGDHEGTFHPQVHVALGDLEADVDEGIAPLILAMWGADIDTVMSCQDNVGGRVWIYTYGPDAERFLSLAAGVYDGDTESLYNRIAQVFEPDDAAIRPRGSPTADSSCFRRVALRTRVVRGL